MQSVEGMLEKTCTALVGVMLIIISEDVKIFMTTDVKTTDFYCHASNIVFELA